MGLLMVANEVNKFQCKGVASRVKRRSIKEMVSKEKVDMILIQETKLEVVDSKVCATIWGDENCAWQVVPAVNRGGGILCIWRDGAFQLDEVRLGHGFIGLVGTWENQNQTCAIVNVYSPCNMDGKRVLWEALLEWKSNSSIQAWCIAGDFNAVRSAEERRGKSTDEAQGRREIDGFNDFIDRMDVFDIPIQGRKYTWYRPNGTAMSRLDRFLVSQMWLELFPAGS